MSLQLFDWVPFPKKYPGLPRAALDLFGLLAVGQLKKGSGSHLEGGFVSGQVGFVPSQKPFHVFSSNVCLCPEPVKTYTKLCGFTRDACSSRTSLRVCC